MLLGQTFTQSGIALSLLVQDQIIDPDPIFGTYHVGFQIINNSLLTLSFSNLLGNGSVFSQADSTTTLLNLSVAAGLKLLSSSIFQVTYDFNYGAQIP